MHKTIELQKPVTFQGMEIGEIRLKEPTGLQYLRLGDPALPVQLGAGGYWIEQPKIIQDYFDLLIEYGDGKHKDGGALLALLSFADVKALKRALFDFFREASETPTG